MTEQRLTVSVGLTVIVSHFVLLILVIALHLGDGFTPGEMTTLVAIIAPMFGIYTTAIIKYFIENKVNIADNSNAVTGPFVFISFSLPLTFVVLLATMITLTAFHKIPLTFDELKGMLGILQTAFGVYMGLLLSSMFDVKEKRKK